MSKKNSTPLIKSEDYSPVVYTCRGREFNGEDLNVVLIAEDTGKESLFDVTKGTKTLRPGGRYTIPTNNERNSIRSSFAEYLGKVEDETLVAGWQLNTRAANAQKERILRHKRELGPDLALLKVLLPLRKEYSKQLGSFRKQAMEMALLDAIRTPVLDGK